MSVLIFACHLNYLIDMTFETLRCLLIISLLSVYLCSMNQLSTCFNPNFLACLTHLYANDKCLSFCFGFLFFIDLNRQLKMTRNKRMRFLCCPWISCPVESSDRKAIREKERDSIRINKLSLTFLAFEFIRSHQSKEAERRPPRFERKKKE
jgi:hypothetical protein